MNRLTNSTCRLITQLLNIIFFMIVNYVAGDPGSGIYFAGVILMEVIFIIFVGSIKDALKKMVAARNYRGFHSNAKQIFRYGLIYAVAMSALFFLFFALAGNGVYSGIFGYSLPASLFTYLSLFFFLRSVREVVGGYYLGMGSDTSYMLSELVYSLALIISSPFTIKSMTSYGSKVADLLKNPMMKHLYSAIGAVEAQCLASFLALILLLVGYRYTRRKISDEFKPIKGVDSRKSFLNNFFRITLSVIGKKLFPTLVVFFITVIYIHGCSKLGIDENTVFTSLGVFAGKYLIVCAAPVVLFIEYVRKEGHKLNEDYTNEEYKTLYHRFGYFLKNTIFIMLPVALSTIVLAKPIVMIFFGGKMSMAIPLVRGGGIVILLAALSLTGRTVLRALHLDINVTIANIAGFATAILYTALTASAGSAISALYIALVLYYIVQIIVITLFIFRSVPMRLMDIGIKAAKVLIASLLMIAVAAMMDKLLVLNVATLILVYIISYAVYLVSIFLLKGVNTKDINSLKGTLIFYPIRYMGKFFLGGF